MLSIFIWKKNSAVFVTNLPIFPLIQLKFMRHFARVNHLHKNNRVNTSPSSTNVDLGSGMNYKIHNKCRNN